MIKIYWPWKNLSCFGLRMGDNFYVDVYPAGGWHRFLPRWWPAGIYCRVGVRRYWWTVGSLVDGYIRRTVG
jgi:hypothetical protein